LAPQIYRTAPRLAAATSGNDAEAAGATHAAAPASQNARSLIGINTEQAMQRGLLFAGNPDTVYQQIMDFYEKVGGFNHLVMIGRSGFMTHAETEKISDCLVTRCYLVCKP
jgi:alkanesulfonate monooxygenase SsuD/methylene tetrahydromethanopterin reductase-like flavin-dependent oxidoreductase (luciferase family)